METLGASRETAHEGLQVKEAEMLPPGGKHTPPSPCWRDWSPGSYDVSQASFSERMIC